MILWAIVVIMLALGIVILPRRRDRIIMAVVLILILLIALPPLDVAYRSSLRMRERFRCTIATKALLSGIRSQILAGETNLAVRAIDEAMSDHSRTAE